MILSTLNLGADVGTCLVTAFARGYLDIPFCLHPDNRGTAKSHLGPDGRLGWSDIGRMPLRGVAEVGTERPLTAAGLLEALSYVQRRHDLEAASGVRRMLDGARDARNGAGHGTDHRVAVPGARGEIGVDRV